jgi:hypothetical protein
MIRTYYNVIFIIFCGVGLLFLPNIIFGLISAERFFKYAVFYAAIFFLALFCITRFKFSIRDNRHWLAFLALISFPFILDITLYRIFYDSYDALKGALYIISWSCMAMCLVWIYNNLFAETKDHFLTMKELLRPYVYLCLSIVLLQILIFILLLLGFLDVLDYPLEPIYGYEFYDRIDRERKYFQGLDEIYIPGYLSVLSISPRSLFLEDLPIVFNGWSYEPHTSTFFVTPSIFFISWYIKSHFYRIIIYLLYIFFFIGASSITNLLSLVFIGLIFVFVESLRKNFSPLISFTQGGFLIIVISLFIPGVTLIFSGIIDALSTLVTWKLIDDSGVSVTRETSQGSWLLQFNPTSFFGSGILKVPRLDEYSFTDVGMITLFTNMILFGSMLVLAFYSLRGNRDSRLIAYSTFYIFMHSLKFPFQYFNYPFWFFIIFIAVLNVSFYRTKFQNND